MAKLETTKEERERWAKLAEFGDSVGHAPNKSKAVLALIRDLDKTLLAVAGLMEIAELAMPDTFFATDSRVCAARELLKEPPSE